MKLKLSILPLKTAILKHFDSFGGQIFQNESRIFFDEFFIRLKGKRAVFRQILAGDPLEAQICHFELVNNHFECKMKHFEPKRMHFEARMMHFEAKIGHFEAKMKHFEAKMNYFEAKMNHFEAAKKHFEAKMKHFEAKMKHFDPKPLKNAGFGPLDPPFWNHDPIKVEIYI